MARTRSRGPWSLVRRSVGGACVVVALLLFFNTEQMRDANVHIFYAGVACTVAALICFFGWKMVVRGAVFMLGLVLVWIALTRWNVDLTSFALIIGGFVFFWAALNPPKFLAR